MELYGLTVIGSIAGAFVWDHFGPEPPLAPPPANGAFSFESSMMASDHRMDLSWLLLPMILPVAMRLHMRRAFLPVLSVLVALLGAAVMIGASVGGLESLPADVIRFVVLDNAGVYGTRAVLAGACGGAWAFFRASPR